MQNSDFIFADHTGIAIGCGPRYGLYIHFELTSGYSSKCDTFENEILSSEAEFQLEFIEVIGLFILIDLDS